MKEKILAVIVMSLLAIGMVLAAGTGNQPVTSSNGSGQMVQAKTATQNQGEVIQVQTQQQAQVQAANSTSDSGKQWQIQAQGNNKTMLKVGNDSVPTSMSMMQGQNGTGLQAKMSNGKNAEVKVMPSTASARALERLRLKNCVTANNCTIELKEVGQGEQVKLAYEVKAQKEAKILGMFKTKMGVAAQVDAQTGEVINSNKPWWAFLASEKDEQ